MWSVQEIDCPGDEQLVPVLITNEVAEPTLR